MAITIYDIIKSPVISHKAYQEQLKNKVVFEVDVRANAPMIKEAVEKIFNVKVVSVNTHIKKPKLKRVGKFFSKGRFIKRAYVTLAKGYVINFFEQTSPEQSAPSA